MKKYLIASMVLGALLFNASSLSAQTADVDLSPTVSSCVSLKYNLKYQSRDSGTGGEVSTFQDFLQSKGYLNSEPTGYFGLLTLNAAKNYQRAHGVDATGYVGPITRAKLQAQTCNGIATPSVSPVTVSPISTGVCTNGALFNSQTGARCTSVPTPVAPQPTTQASLTVTNPLDYHTWTVGDTQTFNWSTNNIPTSASGYIDLVNNGTTYRLANISNTGSYSWTNVGTINGTSLPTGIYSAKIVINNIGDIMGPLTISPRQVTTQPITPLPTPITGDLNSDGQVNAADVQVINTAFGKRTGEIGFNIKADLYVDGVITKEDLAQEFIYLNLAKPSIFNADVDVNGSVGNSDLGIVIGAMNSSNTAADINKDGIVNGIDYGIVLYNFGTTSTVTSSSVAVMQKLEDALKAKRDAYSATGAFDADFDFTNDGRINSTDVGAFYAVRPGSTPQATQEQINLVYTKLLNAVSVRSGSTSADAHYIAGLDLNSNGTINVNDVNILRSAFGK